MSESALHSKTGEQAASRLTTERKESLLETKLFIPSIRLKQVNRPRLLEEVNQGLDKALILVSAPAGYGKTTLISNWLREASMPSAWLSLDEGDNDPVHFLQYSIAAIQRIIPIEAASLDMLQGMRAPSFDHLIRVLINEIAAYKTPFVLILDDFHLIQTQLVLDMVTFILEHMPPQMHLVLLSRTDPPLPLSRLRVRNQLMEIRADHLRFTQAEVAIFLNEVMDLKVHPDDIATLEARTEGWIAGLQLAALSMQRTKDIPGFIRDFAGSHRYVMDYLAEEVLLLQPEPLRLFLLKTSILERMNGPLCDAVVKLAETEPFDGHAILGSLEEMNLFVIPLDDEKHWYRYHHLFADVLNRYLEKEFPGQLRDLHCRASRWYAQNDFIPEAIHHALEAGDQDFAIQLIEQNGCLLLIHGELSTLPNWIKAVEPYAQTHPWIFIFKAWLFALTGSPEQVEEMLQIAERLISPLESSTETRIMQGAIAAARAYRSNLRGETSLAASFARQALEGLPDIDLVSRSLRTVATSLLGDASAMNGNLEESYRAYRKAQQIGQAASDTHLLIVANSNLANIFMEQGLLHRAARIYSETLALATRPGGRKSVIAGRVYGELSQLSYEWNRLETAMEQVHQSMELCRQWGNIDQQATGYVILARLEHVRQHREKALEAMQVAENLTNEYQLLPWYSIWVKCALARLWLAQGNLDEVSHLIQEKGVTAKDEIPYLREPEYLVLLRMLLVQGDVSTALTLSQRLLRQAADAKRMKRVIEVLVLQALIFQNKKDIDQALTVLARALSLARPEAYVRTFLDEGEPMVRLLHLAKARQIETEYTMELLSAAGVATGPAQVSVHTSLDSLSKREVEILRLIEAGCSNQEIATRLFISPATVKRHISNLYAKLGVQSRTQAISIGRELGLFV